MNQTKIYTQKQSMVRKVTISGVIMAMYISIMYFTQGMAFGAYQIRIATSLYTLGGIFPFLIIPMSLSNSLSNILGGLGIFDIVGGFFVGLITTSAAYLIKRYKLNDWFLIIPVVFGPGLIVPIWLSKLLHVPYTALAISLCIGQVIPAILGVILVKRIRDLRL